MTSSNAAIYQPHFLCPHCQSPLRVADKTWLCDGSQNAKNTQHPFDVARQGYVNLLPVQNKKSKDPGDSQESIECRNRFLSQGYYQPLQQLLSTITGSIDIGNSHSSTWLDVGCGEGYYTQAIAQSLSAENASLIALDISKPAVALLARTAKQSNALWYQVDVDDASIAQGAAIYPMVASASRLPLTDDNLTGISSIFSPILPEEFARVLQLGGRLIIAKPDSGHLQSVREALFDEVRPHDSDKFLDSLAPFFKLEKTHDVQAALSLDEQSLSNLLTMTPYSYRARADKREALLASAKQQAFSTEARFLVYELVRQ